MAVEGRLIHHHHHHYHMCQGHHQLQQQLQECQQLLLHVLSKNTLNRDYSSAPTSTQIPHHRQGLVLFDGSPSTAPFTNIGQDQSVSHLITSQIADSPPAHFNGPPAQNGYRPMTQSGIASQVFGLPTSSGPPTLAQYGDHPTYYNQQPTIQPVRTNFGLPPVTQSNLLHNNLYNSFTNGPEIIQSNQNQVHRIN